MSLFTMWSSASAVDYGRERLFPRNELDYSFSYHNFNYNYSYSGIYLGYTLCHVAPELKLFTLTICILAICLISNVFYVAMAILGSHLTDTYFLFLNSFILANVVNVITTGMLRAKNFHNPCWNAGRLACKAASATLNFSKTALIFFLILVILEQTHQNVRKFFLRNDDVQRKLTVTIAILVGAIVYVVPYFALFDIIEYGSDVICTVKDVVDSGVIFSILHIAVIVEYLAPLLILILFLAHGTILQIRERHQRRFGPSSSFDAADNDQTRIPRDTVEASSYPEYRWASVILGLAFFVTRAPQYACLTIFSYGHYGCHRSNTTVLVLHCMSASFSCLAPWIVISLSRFHRRKMRETMVSIASFLSGRRVGRGFALTENEEQVIEIEM